MKTFTKKYAHDLMSAAVIFAVAFLTALVQGGPLTKTVLASAAFAAAGAVVHTFSGKSHGSL